MKTLESEEKTQSLRERLMHDAALIGGGSDGRATAIRLWAGLLGWTESQLRLRMDYNPDTAQRQAFDALLERVLQDEPEAYALGYSYFMGERLNVGPGVLIPRPDSEILLLCALDYLQELAPRSADAAKRPERALLTVLEPCTGSGCLSKALLSHWQRTDCQLSITATELSAQALDYAARNLADECAQGQVQLVAADLWPQTFPSGGFDLLFCNPPYISTDEYSLLESSVKDHEPALALLGGSEGLDFYQRILDEAAAYLQPSAYLLLEHGYRQAEALQRMAGQSADFVWVEMRPDLAGRPRVTVLKKRP